MNLLLLGMNHRTAPLALRERFAVEDVSPLLSKLVAGDEIQEAVLLSTCNRVEVMVSATRLDLARLRLHSFFERELAGADAGGLDGLDDALYEYADASAVQHLFRVACSVDSMVVGEPQILGQVKDAYRAAAACGACGPILTRLFQRGFATAKRVRNETRIAERPVSVARVAVQLANDIFEDLSGKSALLVGAGEMTELALDSLRSAGLSHVRIANRTPARAAGLASRYQASAHGLEQLPELLAVTDVLLTSIGGDAPLLGVDSFTKALRARRGSPIFVIDIGVPRNVDPRVNGLDNVYLYDIDDLAGVAETNAEERRRETVRAEAIVLEEQQRFDGWLSALGAVPTIQDLRNQAERIRLRETERVLNRLALDESQRSGVEALTRGIVNKLLHAPLSRMREQADREQGFATLEAARALFGLDDPGLDDPNAHDSSDPALEGPGLDDSREDQRRDDGAEPPEDPTDLP